MQVGCKLHGGEMSPCANLSAIMLWRDSATLRADSLVRLILYEDIDLLVGHLKIDIGNFPRSIDAEEHGVVGFDFHV